MVKDKASHKECQLLGTVTPVLGPAVLGPAQEEMEDLDSGLVRDISRLSGKGCQHVVWFVDETMK